MIQKAEAESKKMEGKIKYTKGVLNAHIKYRKVAQKNTEYLRDRIITSQGIFSRDQLQENKSGIIIGTVTNVKAKKDAKDRFEIWFNRSSESKFPYGQTSNSDGIVIKIKFNDKTYSIGYHNTKSCIWLSARIDRDGYNLTDLLKSFGIENREKLFLKPIGDDSYEITRTKSASDLNLDTNSSEIVSSRRGKIIELIDQGLTDSEILLIIDQIFPPGLFATSNKQAIYGTKRDLGF